MSASAGVAATRLAVGGVAFQTVVLAPGLGGLTPRRAIRPRRSADGHREMHAS